jgi:hypothetical protein
MLQHCTNTPTRIDRLKFSEDAAFTMICTIWAVLVSILPRGEKKMEPPRRNACMHHVPYFFR